MKSFQTRLQTLCITGLLTGLLTGCASTPECVIDTPETRRAATLKNNAWLKQGLQGELTGADRTDAKARSVDILLDDQQALATITNRWGLSCRMLFSRTGALGALSDCSATKDSWGKVKVIETVTVISNPIELSCTTNATTEVCRGRYQINVNNKQQQHILRLIRPAANDSATN